MFGSKGRAEVRMRKRNFTFLAVNAERKCGCGTSDLCQSRQSGNVEAEHQVFGSQGRAEVWKRNFRSLAVKTERKCSQALWQPSQVGRAGADLNSFDRPISYWLSLPMLKYNYWLLYWRTMWRPCVAKTHDFRNARDKVNMLLQGLWVILDWALS